MEKFKGWDSIDSSKVSAEETDASWIAIQKKIERPARMRRLGWFAVAAAIAVAVISPLASYMWISRQEVNVPLMCQTSTSRGEVREVILPDGTKAVLNAETVLVYPEKFGAERSVFLSGEASFDVTSDEAHPFYVKTSDVTVKVHGTRFNVNAYFDSPSVRATLYRGVITAYPSDNEERAVTLVPNQYFDYERQSGAITTAPTNALEAVAWENGDLCFRSVPIRSVAKTIERRFDVTIDLTTDRYNSAVITANFIHGETLDDLMDALCMIVPGMRYTREENRIYLK